MVRILTGVLVVLGAAGLAWGQEGEKKPAPKAEGAKEGGKEGVKEGGDKGPGVQLLVSEVDTNGDGWISAAELKIALSKLGGGGQKEGGVKKPGPKDGDVKKPEGFKGDAPRKDAPKEGDKEKGEK